MKKISLILMLLISSLPASASWYCNEVASEKNGDTINACGIGEASDEDVARKIALNNAYKELDLICSHSSDCANRALEISPLRTECKKVDSIYRCHRGITATITNEDRDLNQKALLEEVFVPKKIVQTDGRNEFEKSSIVDFDSIPDGATVYIDGIEICKTPCSQEINQGEHKVLFERANYDLVSKIIVIKEGRQSVSQKLSSTFGYLTLLNVPGSAIVKIDNNQVSGRSKIRLSPNEHIVTVQSKFNQPWFKKFTIAKGENLEYGYDAHSLKAFVKISAVDSYNAPIEAKIFVNGQKQSERTPAVIEIPAGESTIQLSYKAHKDLIFSLSTDVGEKTEIKKKLVPSNEKDWNFYLGLGWTAPSVKGVKTESYNGYSCCILLDLSVQRMISKFIAMRGILNYASGSSSSASTTSTPTLSPEYVLTDSKLLVLGLALPIYLQKTDGSGFYVAPEVGSSGSTLTFNKVSYTSGSEVKSRKEDSFGQTYVGILTGWEWMKENANETAYGGYLLSGLRKFGDSDKSDVKSKPIKEIGTVFKGNISFYINFGLIVSF